MSKDALYAHLKGGLTTLCRCWAVIRADGETFGFTDHDGPLSFDGVTFKADSGLTAKALVQTTGLAVDNTEALGALSDAAITEADIRAGRFDGAEVRAWLVNWADLEARVEIFRGAIGEVRRAAGAFTAELRGLTEALNQPQGQVYQRPCSAVLGDARCGLDLDQSAFSAVVQAEVATDNRQFVMALPSFEARWFERGFALVESGAAQGLSGVIKQDRVLDDGRREITLWEPFGGRVVAGDSIRLQAGCDKRAETCRAKFDNFLNFRGFPHIPGEDWLASYPTSNRENEGGSLNTPTFNPQFELDDEQE